MKQIQGDYNADYSFTEEYLQSMQIRRKAQHISQVSREIRRFDTRMDVFTKEIQDVVQRSDETIRIFTSNVLSETKDTRNPNNGIKSLKTEERLSSKKQYKEQSHEKGYHEIISFGFYF